MGTASCFWPEKNWRDMIFRKIGERNLHLFPDAQPSLYHILAESAARESDKIALLDEGGQRYTYGEFLSLSDRLAQSLFESYGVKKGSHVGVLLYNSIEFCVAFFAISRLGAVLVPLPSKYREPEVLSLAKKASITHILCEESFSPWFRNAPELPIPAIVCRREKGYGFSHLWAGSSGALEPQEPQGEPGDPAIIMFTSGTTSQSKGVLLKNYNLVHAIVAYHRIFEIDPSDKTIIATPIYHITGMVALLGLFVRAGASIFLQRKVDGAAMLKCATENKITFLHASPTVFHLLLEHQVEFPQVPSIRRMACGSSNMPGESARRLKRWMPQAEFHTVYGLTETSSPATIFPQGVVGSPYIGSSGLPIPGVEVKICNEAGSSLKPGSSGEILVRGTVVLEHYYPQSLAAPMPDGWFSTGDIGHLNQEGYLWIEDRIKDMINRGGEKICSIDVENEIHALPQVAEAAVVGIPDPKYGETAAAMVRLHRGMELTFEEMLQALAPRLARYKLPSKALIVDALPITPNGKVDKKKIREMFSVIEHP